jgi:hypothetical protein
MTEYWGDWHSGTVKARNRTSGDGEMVWALYTNDRFIVAAVPFQCDWGWCVHLVMRVKPVAVVDGGIEFGPPSGLLTWAAKQRVKDELLGAGRLAVEVFPPAAELVDQADAYHLWVLPEGFKLPFGVE